VTTVERAQPDGTTRDGLVLGLERSNWMRLVIWLAIGLVIYFSYGVRHSSLARRA